MGAAAHQLRPQRHPIPGLTFTPADALHAALKFLPPSATTLALYDFLQANGATDIGRTYVSQADSSRHYSQNCAWNDSTGLWSADNASFPAIDVVMSSSGLMKVRTKYNTSGTWGNLDSNWDSVQTLGNDLISGAGAAFNGQNGAGLTAQSLANVAAQLTGNATRGPLNLVPLATPSTPSNGDVWIDTTLSALVAQIAGSSVIIAQRTTPVGLTTLTYANGWTDASPAARYWKDNGYVHLAGGLATGAVSGAQITSNPLPAGFRPTGAVVVPLQDIGIAQSHGLHISTGGVLTVDLFSGFTGNTSLDGIAFPTF